MLIVSDANRRFMQIVEAKSIPEVEREVKEYGGRNTPLLNHYVPAIGEHGGYVEKKFSVMGAVTLEPVRTVAIVGERLYTQQLVVLKDAGGQLWLDAALHDEVFA